MKLTHYTLLIAYVLGLFSCTPKIDPIFDDSAANRIEKEMLKVREILVNSPSGWLMEMYPSSTQAYGGFNVLMAFSADGRVKVASETAKANATAMSNYSLKQSAGCVLSFDTYNEIFHYFSDPANPDAGYPGYGLEGDLEFIVLSADKYHIRLKGRKTGSYINMTPFSTSISWSDYLNTIKQQSKKLEDYYRLEYQAEGSNYEARLIDHTFCIYRQLGDEKVITYHPFIVTLMGCKFYQPLQLGNSAIEGLYLNASAGNEGVFIPTNDVEGMFVPTNPPLNELLMSRNWFFAYSGMSPYGQKLWDVPREMLKEDGDDLIQCHLGNIVNIFGEFFAFNFTCNKSDGHSYLAFDYELIGDNRIALKFSQEGDTRALKYYKDFKFNYLLEPLGNTTRRVFTLTTDNNKQPTWIKFEEEENPENYFTLYRQQIYYPLAN